MSVEGEIKEMGWVWGIENGDTKREENYLLSEKR